MYFCIVCVTPLVKISSVLTRLACLNKVFTYLPTNSIIDCQRQYVHYEREMNDGNTRIPNESNTSVSSCNYKNNIYAIFVFPQDNCDTMFVLELFNDMLFLSFFSRSYIYFFYSILFYFIRLCQINFKSLAIHTLT